MGSIFNQLLVDEDIEGLGSDCGPKGIATKGRTMFARSKNVHQVAIGQNRADGIHTSTECFPNDYHIRPNLFMLVGKQFACSSQTGLCLIHQEEHIELSTECAYFL